ncbi:hypothetical protein B1A87_015695 [Arthrobacter sp. KBS0703]|uniref:hypothetical protein n=1 Tax=Arthrobacter sp. KBS0703 TaxID=1955698 RepID=UPI0011862841|nr:hypothetical protein [Arthrobacter sp. KBS0703]TSE17034.1 hypothetical protein B1A87_015695 [Arthrobacter sp. KBS0703]
MSVSPTGREEGDIQAILQDSGFEEDTDLRRSLEDLRAFALDGPPEPRADLQALLTPGVTLLDVRRRNRKRRMGVVVGAAVVGAMGLGAGAVAASGEDFRLSVSHAVVKILEPASQAPAATTDAPASAPDASVPPGAPSAAVTPSPSATPSGSAAAVKSARPQAAASARPASARPTPGNAASAPGGKQAQTPVAPLRPTPVPATARGARSGTSRCV